MELNEIVAISAVRTAMGRFGGTLKDMASYDIGAVAVKAAWERAGVKPEDIDEAIIGNCRQAGNGPNPARTAAVRGGLPVGCPVQTINMACPSGMKAAQLASQSIRLGDSETVDEYLRISHKDAEPIQSQFQLSYNTILNMLDMYSHQEIDRLLRQNFYAFRKQHRHHRQVRMKTSFSRKCRQLLVMRYLTSNNALTEKGRFAKKIYFEELLISELFATPLYTQLTDTELLQVITGIVYERRPNDHFSFHGISRSYQRLISKIRKNPHFFNKLNKLSLKRMMALVDVWSNGGDFEDILTLTTYREGDVVRLFRRVIDMLQQIRRATDDEVLITRLLECQERIDRDLVAVEFV